jgi:two-component system chemotaxis response regulator CheB
MPSIPVRILIIDDSEVARQYLGQLFAADPECQVLAAVGTAREGMDLALRRRPDVITMDVRLPDQDGFEATRTIMEIAPTPIVIVTNLAESGDAGVTFAALSAGALACLPKPRGGNPAADQAAQHLVRTVKAMAGVKVVRRRPRRPGMETTTVSREAVTGSQTSTATFAAPRRDPLEVVAIGGSTGAPPVLQTLLAALPESFPAPILIVQHITEGFLAGMATWLNQSSHLPVSVATDGLRTEPGRVYLAPTDQHLEYTRLGRLRLTSAPAEYGMRPAASVLFRSVAAACGPRACGIILTGMGRDGAAELKLIRDQGGLTIAQDAASSVVHGMPGEAIRLQAAKHILPPARIIDLLVALTTQP